MLAERLKHIFTMVLPLSRGGEVYFLYLLQEEYFVRIH